MCSAMRRILLALAVLLAAALPACVERTLSIETVPEKADVFLDGQLLGQSPVTVPFTHYGTREIVVRKAGYRTERHLETMIPPHFQDPPYDLYYEILTRDRYVDHRPYRYVLAPQDESDTSRAVVEKTMEDAKAVRVK